MELGDSRRRVYTSNEKRSYVEHRPAKGRDSKARLRYQYKYRVKQYTESVRSEQAADVLYRFDSNENIEPLLYRDIRVLSMANARVNRTTQMADPWIYDYHQPD